MNIDMLSIGQIAELTGVTRRMIRHWEDEGLINPARVSEFTGYRGYLSAQVGRIQTIKNLRDLGFGLPEIKLLIDSNIEFFTLRQHLEDQIFSLKKEIEEASICLHTIQNRLDLLQRYSSEAEMNISQQSLEEINLLGKSTTVFDETDIPSAVEELRGEIEPIYDAAIDSLYLIYDGRSPNKIEIFLGISSLESNRNFEKLYVKPTKTGVSITFSDIVTNVSDAWVSIDKVLGEQNLQTWGIYRQIIRPNGATILQAEVQTA